LTDEKELCNKRASDFHVVITNYDTFKNSMNLTWKILKKSFQWIILDEGHRFKNKQTQIYKNLSSVNAKYRWYVTGKNAASFPIMTVKSYTCFRDHFRSNS
jgi:SNF2 family DNA or RNA helicase